MNPLLESMKTMNNDELWEAVKALVKPYVEELQEINSCAGKEPLDESTIIRFTDGFILGVYSRMGALNWNRRPPTALWSSRAAKRRASFWSEVLWNRWCDHKLRETPSNLTDPDIRKRIANGEQKWIDAKKRIKAKYFLGFRDGDFLASQLIYNQNFMPPTAEELRQAIRKEFAEGKIP